MIVIKRFWVSGKIIDRNYGSIPHLSTSKMNQRADKKIELGQEKILTIKTRDSRDLIIVTEKIDGSNVGVIKKNGRILPITRAGYLADSSPYKQHHLFTKYIYRNKESFEWLPENWRICGEWCLLAHGTVYDISKESPFISFDIFDETNSRLLFSDFYKLCFDHLIPSVPVLHTGLSLSIDSALELLGDGHYGHPEKPEGVVYRVERNGRVDFLAKWVRSDKADGKFLEEEKWNIGAEVYF